MQDQPEETENWLWENEHEQLNHLKSWHYFRN